MIKDEWRFPDGGVLRRPVSLELEPGNPASRKRIETQVLHYGVDTWRAYNYLWNDEQTTRCCKALTAATERSKSKTKKLPAVCDNKPASRGPYRMHSLPHHASRLDPWVSHPATQPRSRTTPSEPADRDGEPTRDVRSSRLFRQAAPREAESPGSIRTMDQLRSTPGPDLSAHQLRPLPPSRGRRLGSIRHSNHDADRKEHAPRTRPTTRNKNVRHPRCQIVAPGDPWRSVLYYRMMKLGSGRMPQFGSKMVDDRGTHLILKWITSSGEPPKTCAPSC